MTQQYLGTDTIDSVAYQLIQKLVEDKAIQRQIDKVEPNSVQLFELRVKLGKAIYFVTNYACALRRNILQEIVLLFFISLKKLNTVLDLISSIINNLEPFFNFKAQLESVEFRAVVIQETIFSLYRLSIKALPYNVLKVLLKAKLAYTARALFYKIASTYLPKGIPIYLLTKPSSAIATSFSSSLFPYILIHLSNSVRGQTYIVVAVIQRTSTFFQDYSLSKQDIDRLRIIYILLTRVLSCLQFTVRNNNILLSPSLFSISSFKLAIIQVNQLLFPQPSQ